MNSVNMNTLNTLLLVIVLIIVIVCYVKQSNESFKSVFKSCKKDPEYKKNGWFTNFCNKSLNPIIKYKACLGRGGGTDGLPRTTEIRQLAVSWKIL